MQKFIRNLKCDFYENKNDLNSLCESYKEWVSKSEYLVFKNKDSIVEDSQGLGTPYPEEYYCFKCIKRGNDVYRYRVSRNLKPLLDLGLTNEDIKFIKEEKPKVYLFSFFVCNIDV